MQLLRYISLLLFALAHVQEVFPILAPATLCAVVIAHLNLFVAYRRMPLSILLAGLFIAYVFVLIVVHNILADRSLFDVVRMNGRVVYMLAVMLTFAHMNVRSTIESHFHSSWVFVTLAISAVSAYSLYVSPIVIQETRLSSANHLLGLVGNHNTMAAQLGVAMLIVMMGWNHGLQYKQPRLFNGWKAVIIVPLALAFLAALSRSYTLAMLCSSAVLVWGVNHRTWRPLLISAGLFIGVAGAAFVQLNRSEVSDYNNIESRTAMYKRGLAEMQRSPIIGIGPGVFEEWDVAYRVIIPNVLSLRVSGREASSLDYQDSKGGGGVHAHNSYIQTICDFGLIGMFWLACIFVLPYRAAAGNLNHSVTDEEENGVRGLMTFNLRCVLQVGLFLLVAGNFSGYCFISPPLSLVLYVSTGRLIALNMQLSPSPETD